MPGDSAQTDAYQPLVKSHYELGELFKIHLTNVLFTLLTLGIYRFWAKTRMRRYLWSHVEIEGDRLEYTGTAKELLFGFLIIVAVLIIPVLIVPEVINLAAVASPEIQSAVGGLQGLIIFFLIPIAIFRARRYRLTRTRWRGIRGGQTGSSLAYAGTSFLWSILNVVTLGLAIPYTRTYLARYRTKHTWFGNRSMVLDAKGRRLYPALFVSFLLYFAVLAVVLALAAAIFFPVVQTVFEGGTPNPEEIIASLGTESVQLIVVFALIVVFLLTMGLFTIPTLWYAAAEVRYFASCLNFMNLGFELDTGRWRYVCFMWTNQLMALLSLGLLLPVVYKRYVDFYAERFRYAGSFSEHDLSQSELGAPERGEGLADAFDIGGI